MSDTGVAAIDEAQAHAGAWLDDISAETGAGPQAAYQVLRAGLHALRDRLMPEEAVHLSAQLPPLIRGIYFEGWKMSRTPETERHLDAWLARLGRELAEAEVRPEDASRAVFAVLKRRCGAGELAHVRGQLPAEIAEAMDAA